MRVRVRVRVRVDHPLRSLATGSGLVGGCGGGRHGDSRYRLGAAGGALPL